MNRPSIIDDDISLAITPVLCLYSIVLDSKYQVKMVLSNIGLRKGRADIMIIAVVQAVLHHHTDKDLSLNIPFQSQSISFND